MAKSAGRFKELLDKGIERIVQITKKKRGIIHDELGFALGRESGSSIAYFVYGDGHIPAQLQDVEKLARTILDRTDLNREWLEGFLESAGYPNVKWFCDQHFPPSLTGASALPPRAYRQLVGRDALIQDILDALHAREGERIVAIDGMGGIGKTSMAQEVVRRSLSTGIYEGALWISVGRGGEGSFSYENLLDAIGSEVGDRGIHDLRLVEKERRIRQYLREQRLILVLDGLEAAEAEQEEIVRRLFPLLSTSKALLTSRRRFAGDLLPVHLAGLPERASSELIEQVATEKRIDGALGVKKDEVEKIFATTGGSPLALKLVVGQLEHLPMNVVLERLRRVVSPIAGRADEYTQLYRHIFWPSWELLEESCKELLVGLSHFAPGLGGTFSALQRLNLYSELALGLYIDRLWRFSLLEIGEAAGADDRRYYLHALTQHFVQSDIVGLVSSEGM